VCWTAPIRFLLLTIAVLVAAWLAFAVWLALMQRRSTPPGEVVRLVPDVLRLIRRLARDRTIARSVRFPVWLLIAYLASPLDLVPDVIPVIGFADDVIVIAVVLRRLVRRAGPDTVERHWSGTPEGLVALRALLRLPASS
jgi:uncharacterized membrane protein YkvA (DUF1232 family)